MVLFNHATRELTAKIVYYGPGLCGKTTNLKLLHERLEKGTAGRLLSLATAQDRTIYFDLLPVELGNIKGYTVRFQLCTVPGQVFYNETRKLVLRGVDGIVFVVDSQWSMLSHDLESFQNLRDNLREADISLETIPLVVQYNKRDLPGVLGVDALQEALSFQSYPYVEAVAAGGHGVLETFKLISKLTFVDLLRRLQRTGGTESEAADALLQASGEGAGLVKSSQVRKSTFVPPVAPPPPSLPAPPEEGLWSTIITHEDVFSETVPKKPSRPAGSPPTTTSGSISVPRPAEALPVPAPSVRAPAAPPFEAETDVFGLSQPTPEEPPAPLIDLPPPSLELPMLSVRQTLALGEPAGLEPLSLGPLSLEPEVGEPEPVAAEPEPEPIAAPPTPEEPPVDRLEAPVDQPPAEEEPPPPQPTEPLGQPDGQESQPESLSLTALEPEAEPEPAPEPEPREIAPELSERLSAVAHLLERLVGEVDDHEERLTRLATRIGESDEVMSRAAGNAKGSAAMVAVLQGELTKIRAEIDRVGSEADGSVTSIEILRNELEGARNDIDRITTEIAAEVSTRLAETRTALEAARLKSDEVAQARLREEMRRLSSEAPTASAWKTELVELKSEVDKIQAVTGSGEQALRAGLADVTSRLVELTAQHEGLAARVDRPSADLVIMRERVDSLRLELDVAKSGLAEARSAVQDLRRGLGEADSALSEVRAQVSTVTAATAQVTEDLAQTKESFAELKTGHDASTKALFEVRAEISGTKSSLKSLEAKLEDIAGLRHELSDLSALKAAVAGQAALMEALLEDQLTNLRNEMLAEIGAVKAALAEELGSVREGAKTEGARLDASLADVARELQSVRESLATSGSERETLAARLDGLEGQVVTVGAGAEAHKAAVEERLTATERRSRTLAESLRRALEELT